MPQKRRSQAFASVLFAAGVVLTGGPAADAKPLPSEDTTSVVREEATADAPLDVTVINSGETTDRGHGGGGCPSKTGNVNCV